MDLNEAIELIWTNRKYDTKSETEAISHLNEEVAESLKALLKNDKAKAQVELEDALSCLFIALKVLNINPEEAVLRQIEKMKNQPIKTLHIFSNRVEIRVSNEIRGGWAIWSNEELKEAKKMANEFNCKVIWEETPIFENMEELTNAKN